MQQYRVNYVLLIGLLVGSLITLVAAYSLWKFQINRNAGSLIEAATKAQEEGDLRAAAQDYGNYLSIRPKDEEVRVKLANVWIDVTEQPEVEPEDWGRSINYLEDTVRKLPEEKALQRRLVDLYSRIGQTQQALDHLGRMLAKYPDDAELQVLQMEQLMRARKFDGTDGAVTKCKKLVGYDEKTDTFDEKKAVAPNNAEVYGNYAALLRSYQEKPELADRVMDQLIKVNPDLAAAYLQRGQYLVSIGEPDRGQRDIDKAFKLAPEDGDVLLAMAGRAEANKNMDRAYELLEHARKAHPEDPRFYQALAGLKMKDQKYDEALALIGEGLKAVPRQEAQNLLFFKAELQFMANDVEGARETAKEMRKSGFREEFVDWMEARILLAQNKWYEASKALYNLKPKMGDSGPYADQIAVQLGLAYERSGRLDLAEDAYDVVLQRNPANEPAQAGKQRVAAMRGRPTKDADTEDIDKEFAKILQQPKDKRNWARIDAELKKLAVERKLEGAALDLFWAKVMLMREDYGAARKYLVDGGKKDPENLDIRRTAVLWLRTDPSQGTDKALKLLDDVVEKFGDRAELRLDRADCLIAQNQKDPDNDALKEKLATLAEAPTDWDDAAKVTLWNGMAGRYLAIGQRDEAKARLLLVADSQPDNLPTRVAIFALALEANDDVAMRAAQDDILKVVGRKDDSNWLYSEARRLLSLFRRGQVGKETLAEVRQLVEKAMDDRPNWFELQLVSAEVDLLDGKEDDALMHFERAQELGRPNGAAVLQHVRLLLNRSQFDKAKDLIETLPETVREGDLGQVYAETLINTGHLEEAVAVGKKFADAAPESGERRLAYGQLLARAATSSSLSDERRKELVNQSDEALQAAVKLAPESPEAWLALITLQVLRQDLPAAQLSLQQAQLALADDQLVGVLAKGYEIMGQWFNAENVYVTALQMQPENYRLAQELATFYLGQAYPRPDKIAKATPLVNQILHAGADGKLPPSDTGLMWARRAAAQMLASTREYQQLLKAEKLLASNAQSGVLPAEDRMRMAEILAPRPEPISRIKAKNLLELVSERPAVESAG